MNKYSMKTLRLNVVLMGDDLQQRLIKNYISVCVMSTVDSKDDLKLTIFVNSDWTAVLIQMREMSITSGVSDLTLRTLMGPRT